jgi:parvulin-like peptidyl-prolyl isomerase
MVAHQFTDVAEHDVARSLGDDFLKAITISPTGSWQGPIKSGFGLHLVRIDNREQQMQAELSEVRDAVLRDWKSEKLKLTNEAVYNSMRSQYKISVESETLKSVDTKLIAKG